MGLLAAIDDGIASSGKVNSCCRVMLPPSSTAPIGEDDDLVMYSITCKSALACHMLMTTRCFAYRASQLVRPLPTPLRGLEHMYTVPGARTVSILSTFLEQHYACEGIALL